MFGLFRWPGNECGHADSICSFMGDNVELAMLTKVRVTALAALVVAPTDTLPF